MGDSGDCGAAEVEEYVNNAILKIKEDNNSALSSMEKQYKIAVLLTTIGKNKESMEYFSSAVEDLRKVQETFVYGELFCSAGTAYAIALDNLNEVTLAEQMFQEVYEANPKGVHVGDFAVFLHKRKRDNKRAEK